MTAQTIIAEPEWLQDEAEEPEIDLVTLAYLAGVAGLVVWGLVGWWRVM